MTTTTQRQISRAKSEAETSLVNANGLRDQWLVAIGSNPTGLTQKDIEHLTKAFKNRLLTVKWDCEDLEELVATNQGGKNGVQSDELREARDFLEKCKIEISESMNQLEEFETNKKIFNKHGITTTTTTTTTSSGAPTIPAIPPPPPPPVKTTITLDGQTATQPVVASIIQNPLHNEIAPPYQSLLLESQTSRQFDTNGLSHNQAHDQDDAELSFDKSQIESSATIFNNALYEHYEQTGSGEDYLTKGLNSTRVFNNLTRPNTDNADVFGSTNENEMILDMLETEYYNQSSGLMAKTKYNTTVRKLFNGDRNKFLGTIMLILSFPVVLMLFLVI